MDKYILKQKTILSFLIKTMIIMLFSLLIVCYTNSVFSQDGEKNVLSKMKEIEKKWQEYLQTLGNIEGTIHYQYINNGVVDYDYYNEFVGMYPLLIDSRGKLNDYDTVNVFGKSYRFLLKRSEADKKWFVETIEPDSANKKKSELKFPVYLEESIDDPIGYNIFNTLGVGLFGIDSEANLPYMFSSEYFTIKELKEIEQNGGKQWRLSFEFEIPDFPESVKKRPDFEQNASRWSKFTLLGNVTLVTSSFLVSDAEYHLKYLSLTNDVNVTVSYDTETCRIPLPKEYHAKAVSRENEGNKNVYEIIQNFDLKETSPRAVSRFTLSAYGLPEPDFGESRASRMRYIILVTGLLLISLGVWRIYRRRDEKIG